MKNQDSNVFEIDILFLLKTLFRKKFLILVVALATAGIGLVYSLFIAKPTYDSTTRIYVVTQSSQGVPGITNQDLQAGTYLVQDYKEIILSQDVLREVSNELDLKDKLESKIRVEIPVDTRIVSITVRDTDAEEAARIANHVRQTAAQKIIDVTKVSDVTTLEEAIPATKPSTPNTKRNVLLGFVAGATLVMATILFKEVMDDRVKRPEDIEEMMGIPLLGVVPTIENVKVK